MSVKFGRERLRAECTHPWVLPERLSRRQVHKPETSGIIVGDGPTIIEDKNDMIVFRIL